MKTVEFYSNAEKVKIVLIADIHYGSKECDVTVLEKAVNTVLSEPNTYAIINGDLCDNAIKDSVGNVYDDSKPMDQLNTIVKALEPIKEKIICVTCGNHERRTSKVAGIDIMALACTQLGLLDKYDENGVVVIARIGPKPKKKCYTIFVTHGTGGGRTAGGKVNRLLQLSSIVDADIYVHAHTHEPFTTRKLFYRIDR